MKLMSYIYGGTSSEQVHVLYLLESSSREAILLLSFYLTMRGFIELN